MQASPTKYMHVRLSAAASAAVINFNLAMPPSAERLRAFEQDHYRGENRIYSTPIPNLAATQSGSAIKSVRIITGRWLLCARPNYAGDCAWVAHDLPSLADDGFQAPVVSLRP